MVMSYLLDTNILLRIVDSNHPMNADAVEAIDSLRTSDTPLFIATQNLTFFQKKSLVWKFRAM